MLHVLYYNPLDYLVTVGLPITLDY